MSSCRRKSLVTVALLNALCKEDKVDEAIALTNKSVARASSETRSHSQSLLMDSMYSVLIPSMKILGLLT